MRKLLVLILILFVQACVSNDMSDLHAFVKKTKATYKGHVEPLPEFKHYPPYTYAAQDIRDPFKAVVDIEVEDSAVKGPRPDENRPKEPLEEFSLDSLRMVGTLGQDAEEWALIQDPDGLLHRVSKGHYLGKNYGKIIALSNEEINIIELVPDRKGGWEERNATIALSE